MRADGYTQLVFHLFAHLHIGGPGQLWDPAYAAWIGPRLDPEHRRMLEHDAALLTRLWAEDPGLDDLLAIDELHGDLEGFRRGAARALAELDAAEVQDPALLARLCDRPAAELLHASLAALDPGFARALAQVEDELHAAERALAPWLAHAVEFEAGLGARRVETVAALGAHGRGSARRILVGLPLGWAAIDPSLPAVLALHEHHVLACPDRDYARAEAHGLIALARRMHEEGADDHLRACHRRWLASLDLDALLAELIEGEQVTATAAAELRARPDARAELFARLPHPT